MFKPKHLAWRSRVWRRAISPARMPACAGGNVLVGGSNNTIALQPLSVQGQVGLNVAAGLESLELRPGR